MVTCLKKIFNHYFKRRNSYFHRKLILDDLTGIWNSEKFIHETENIIKKSSKEYILVFIDIDNFKYINGSYGYEFGNLVLVDLADKINKQLEYCGYFCRYGADRFLILLEKSIAGRFACNIQDIPEYIVHYEMDHMKYIKIPLKFGICPINDSNRNEPVQKLIDCANIAMRSIKGMHNQCAAYYSEELKKQRRMEIDIIHRMDYALANGEFCVFLQPKYSIHTEKIVGAEALVRWIHPVEGSLSPALFIPIFEKNGFIVHLDFFVYEEVLRYMQNCIRERRRIFPIALNVSRTHVDNNDFVERLISLVDRYQVPHEMIELEVTESAFSAETSALLNMIEKLKKAKFLISIDDFGTGYSSLNLLKDVPVDILKIAREFLIQTEESEASRIIIEEVVHMAKRLNIHTICEGVENKTQVEFLCNIGCDMAQGYYYSKPMPLQDFQSKYQMDGSDCNK